jgi:uncharacterized protein (DUF983 family)
MSKETRKLKKLEKIEKRIERISKMSDECFECEQRILAAKRDSLKNSANINIVLGLLLLIPGLFIPTFWVVMCCIFGVLTCETMAFVQNILAERTNTQYKLNINNRYIVNKSTEQLNVEKQAEVESSRIIEKMAEKADVEAEEDYVAGCYETMPKNSVPKPLSDANDEFNGEVDIL